MYDVKSSKAEEFISDEEILDTLDYAEKNKSNKELIELRSTGGKRENVSFGGTN